MSQRERASGLGPSPADDLEPAALTAAQVQAVAEAGAAIARQLNGPLTALLLYMGEIKQHGRELSQAQGDRIYLQQVVENALQQTERICALLKQIENFDAESAAAPRRKVDKPLAGPARDETGAAGVVFSSEVGQKPLTKREYEVLNLISEGYSNKQGALQMHISPRTFESHRAEAMRKLGARNTAELVRAALKHPGSA
ncbi:LuxR C-terminal-related transcriptional regulator [Bradyrhizobium sp.]|uniref:response regulator transcription factor n=1 Tax=Bradyrhizobium sp. TaxID=376 RepID=UPI003C726751